MVAELPLGTLELATGQLLLSDVLSAASSLHEKHARYEEMDAALLRDFELTCAPPAGEEKTAPLQSAGEKALLADCIGHAAKPWRRMPGTVTLPTSFFSCSEGEAFGSSLLSISRTVQNFSKVSASGSGLSSGGSGVGAAASKSPTSWAKGVTKVDAPAKRVLSYERMANHFEGKSKKLMRAAVPISPRSTLYVNEVRFPQNFSNRVFCSWFTWGRLASPPAEDDFIIGYAPLEDFTGPLPPAAARLQAKIAGLVSTKSLVRGKIRGFYRVRAVTPNSCELTCIQQGDPGGMIPRWVVDLQIKKSLESVDKTRERHVRNGKAVDDEYRSTFPAPPLLSSLTEEQQSIVTSCKQMEADAVNNNVAHDVEWKAVKSLSPFVSMERKVFSGRNMIGRATSVIHCPPAEVLIWFFYFDSRERTKASVEQRNPARVLISRPSAYDITGATVKRSPLLFWAREFVFRSLCCVESPGGDLLMASESVPASVRVDYGSKLKVVRATLRQCLRVAAIPNAPGECQVTFHQHLVSGGWIPNFVSKSKISTSLRPVVFLHQHFQRDDDVDRTSREALADAIKTGAPIYDELETGHIAATVAVFQSLAEAQYTTLESSEPLVKMSIAFIKGIGSGVMRASCVIDAKPELGAALEMSKMSNFQQNMHFKKGNTDGYIVEVNDHHKLFHRVFKIPVLKAREMLTRIVWRWEDAELPRLVVYSKSVALPHIPPDPSCVLMDQTNIWTFQELPPSNGVPSTRMELIQQVDLKGAIPKQLVNKEAANHLSLISHYREFLSRSAQLDTLQRGDIMAAMKLEREARGDGEIRLGEEEEEIIKLGLERLKVFEPGGAVGKVRSVKSPNATVKNSIAFKKGDPLAWGRSKCAIRAPKEDILAYIWAMDARCRWGDTDLEREILEKKSLHSIVVYQLKGGSRHGPLKLKPRGGVQQLVWKQVDARTLVIAVQPVESHPAKPSSDGVVDAQMHLTIVLRESGPRSCNFTYVARMDLGGDVPNAISNFYLWKNLGLGHRMQVYYAGLTSSNRWDEEDGQLLGE
ncbi:hypothetical protein TeGR_g6547, partial [Tetraparma gracilis]